MLREQHPPVTANGTGTAGSLGIPTALVLLLAEGHPLTLPFCQKCPGRRRDAVNAWRMPTRRPLPVALPGASQLEAHCHDVGGAGLRSSMCTAACWPHGLTAACTSLRHHHDRATVTVPQCFNALPAVANEVSGSHWHHTTSGKSEHSLAWEPHMTGHPDACGDP